MKNIVIGFLIVTWLLAGSPAGAQEEAGGDGEGDFEATVSEAMRHYGAREYEQAIELFERAYSIQEEPELVYNIARSHERLAHREEALAAYERFISLPGTTGELRTRALTNIRSLREEIAAMEAAANAGQGSGSDSGTGGETGPATPPPVEDEGTPPMSIAGYALIGIGAASMIGGAVFGALALSAHGDFEEAGYTEERLQLRDDVQTRALLSDILLFSGAGLAVVGVALVLVSYLRNRPGDEGDAEATTEARRGLQLAPSLAVGDSWGLGLTGRF